MQMNSLLKSQDMGLQHYNDHIILSTYNTDANQENIYGSLYDDKNL